MPGRGWRKSWIFDVEPDGLKIDLKHLARGPTKTLGPDCGRTKGLFQEAGLCSCVPEGLANPRGELNGLRVLRSYPLFSIVPTCSETLTKGGFRHRT